MFLLCWLIIVFVTIEARQRVFNLISTGKTIDHTPFHTEEDIPYQRCVSICSLNQECNSFDFTPTPLFGVCNFYDISFVTYQNESRALKQQTGTTFYSYLVFTNCADWYKVGVRKNGVYEVYLLGLYRRRVYCLMEQAGGGWMAFQRRYDGSVEFFSRDWNDCKNGFGNGEGEY